MCTTWGQIWKVTPFFPIFPLSDLQFTFLMETFERPLADVINLVTALLLKRWVRIRLCIYRVILKSRRDFRPLRYSSWDGHAEGEHVNRGRHTPSFCPTLQVLDMSIVGDAADVNPVIKFLPHTCNVFGHIEHL